MEVCRYVRWPCLNCADTSHRWPCRNCADTFHRWPCWKCPDTSQNGCPAGMGPKLRPFSKCADTSHRWCVDASQMVALLELCRYFPCWIVPILPICGSVGLVLELCRYFSSVALLEVCRYFLNGGPVRIVPILPKRWPWNCADTTQNVVLLKLRGNFSSVALLELCRYIPNVGPVGIVPILP